MEYRLYFYTKEEKHRTHKEEVMENTIKKKMWVNFGRVCDCNFGARERKQKFDG